MKLSELTISIMERTSSPEEAACAIEVQNIADDITQEMLERFFKNERESGNSHFKNLLFNEQKRKAVVTFTDPTGVFFHQSRKSVGFFLFILSRTIQKEDPVI